MSLMNTHTKELFNLSQKVAIVTGGAGWLGSAISEALAEAGATVAIVDNNADNVKNITEKLKNQGLKIFGVVADVMQDKPLRECIDKVVSDNGRLDIQVNCAYSCPVPELDKASYKDFDEGFHSAPSAYGIASQQAVIHMRKTGGGTIINLGSMYGLVTGYPEVYEGITSPNSIVYQAGKAAIIHMTRYMAVYWAKDNIRVNCLSPGPFPPPSTDKKIIKLTQRLEKKSPMRRMGKPWELKGAAVFLASGASSYVTGQNIIVDGGWTLW